jgi:hypothetical protein
MSSQDEHLSARELRKIDLAFKRAAAVELKKAKQQALAKGREERAAKKREGCCCR